MKEKILADLEIEELGLGDLVNRFASVDQSATLFFRDFSRCRKVKEPEKVIRDIVKNKGVRLKKIKSRKDCQGFVPIKRNELGWNNPTELVFSSLEIEWAKEILKDCGLIRKEKILAICNNLPGGKGSYKMWREQHWVSFVSGVLQADPEYKVLLLPNFRKPGDRSDQVITESLSQKFPLVKIFSFQEYFLNNQTRICLAQKSFGRTRNSNGFSIRQFGILAFVLLGRERNFAIFNDTGLAHLAIAAIGKNGSERIISVNVENIDCYGLRNGGKSFPFEVGGEKTEPEKVASFILNYGVQTQDK